MPSNVNTAQVLGCIVSNEVRGTTFPSTYTTLAGEYEVIGNDGKARNVPFYQTVTSRNKEGEEAAKLALGTPVIALGSLHYRDWLDDEGRKRTQTNVRAQTIRPLLGIDESRIVFDAKGQARLTGGYARVTMEANVSRDPDYKILSGGSVINIGAASSDSWQKDGEWVNHTNWLRLVAWRELAEELFALNVGKGFKLIFEADIVNSKSYVSTKTGLTEYPVDLNLRTVHVTGRSSGGGGGTVSLDDLLGQEYAPEEDLELAGLPF